MRVKVGTRIYQMSRKQVDKMLVMASDLVPCGIYALKINDYIELRNDPMSPEEIKKEKRKYKKAGVKVYANGRQDSI